MSQKLQKPAQRKYASTVTSQSSDHRYASLRAFAPFINVQPINRFRTMKLCLMLGAIGRLRSYCPPLMATGDHWHQHDGQVGALRNQRRQARLAPVDTVAETALPS